MSPVNNPSEARGPSAEQAFRRWLCEACGLIYDEARGDPDSGIAAGTRFEDIPDDWTCPVCGVGKADFKPLEPAPAAAAASARQKKPALQAAADDHGVVIVGAGLAGWSTARALRSAGFDGPVSIVTACDGTVYSKPALSVCGGKGIALEALAQQTGADLADELGVRLLAHTWAIELDAARRRVLTTRGTLRYRRLVLASGARARRLNLEGPGSTRLFSVNDLQAYRAFRQAFDAATARVEASGRPVRLLIIGAGLVGCEFANDLASLGARVTLLDTAAWPLQARLDRHSGEQLRDALAAQGVWFDPGARLGPVCIPAGAPDCASVQLEWTSACGTRQARAFDLGLMAVGVEAEVRVAARAGLAVGRGIVVDPCSLLTSNPDIYALGDCAEINGQLGCTIEPIHRQARTIAGEITGAPQPFAVHSPVWVVKTPCLPITIRSEGVSVGSPDSSGRHSEVTAADPA